MLLLEFTHRYLRNALATSIIHILCLVIILFCVRATTADSITHGDHNHHRLPGLRSEVYGISDQASEPEAGGYEPEFLGIDRSIIGRADGAPQELHNNYPGRNNIKYGETQVWTFPSKEYKSRALRDFSAHASLAEKDFWDTALASHNPENGALQQRQADDTRLFITLNICDQPQPKTANSNGAPAPLQLYISTNPKNQKPNQKISDYAVSVDGGYGSRDFTVSDDVYLSVTAPAKSSQFEGEYSYELTASIDEYYTITNALNGMKVLDSDANATLLATDFQTDTPSYGLFVHPQDDPAIVGLQSSFCGLKSWARRKGNIPGLSTGDIDTGVMKLGPAGMMQVFHVKELNSSSAYYGILAFNGSSPADGIAGGGGTVYSTTNFLTKASSNCAVIYNLTFCSDVAYAVPSNTTMTNTTALAELYDNDAREKYRNFDKSLQQIPCDTTSSAQYSLARNCQDCSDDYRTWLCAVTIPRCEDFSSDAQWLMPRLINETFSNGTQATGPFQLPYDIEYESAAFMNSSRNPMIDEVIKPGPYKEVLPCNNLCYEIVRSCPASLGFACPLEKHGLDLAYGVNSSDNNVTCNYPGAPFTTGIGNRLMGNFGVMGAALLVALMVLV